MDLPDEDWPSVFPVTLDLCRSLSSLVSYHALQLLWVNGGAYVNYLVYSIPPVSSFSSIAPSFHDAFATSFPFGRDSRLPCTACCWCTSPNPKPRNMQKDQSCNLVRIELLLACFQKLTGYRGGGVAGITAAVGFPLVPRNSSDNIGIHSKHWPMRQSTISRFLNTAIL